MQKIMEAIECVLAFLRKIPLSNSSIKQYKIYLRSSIVPYCEANCMESFSDDEMQAYAEEQMSKAENGEFSKSTMIHRRKAAALLADYMQGRELVWKQKSFKVRSFCEADIPHEAWDGKSFHALRRTFGTRLVRAGVPIRFVGESLGMQIRTPLNVILP